MTTPAEARKLADQLRGTASVLRDMGRNPEQLVEAESALRSLADQVELLEAEKTSAPAVVPLTDGMWYWVRYEGLGKTYEAPAMYRADAKAFYSVDFSGIPERQVKVLHRIHGEEVHAPPESEADYRRGYRDGYNRRDDEVKAALT